METAYNRVKYLTELRNCVRHKNKRKDNQHSKLLFFKINLPFGTLRVNLFICKTKFSSHKQYLFDLLLPRNAKKTQIQTKAYYKLFTLSEMKCLTTL